MRYLLKLAALMLLLLSGAARAQSDVPRRLAAYMDAHARIYGFSGAVLLKKGDQVLLRQAYGLADREWAVPNPVDARFRIASTSKAFTAVAIMKLVEAGRLSLDDTLERHLPGFPSGDRITIRMMLNHTSGLPRGHDMDVATDIFMTRERALPILRAKPLAFEPGTQSGYSNTAYLLLSYIIEGVSGRSYAQFLDEQVLRPAGLRDTGVYGSDRLIVRMARHYRRESQAPGAAIETAWTPNYDMF